MADKVRVEILSQQRVEAALGERPAPDVELKGVVLGSGSGLPRDGQIGDVLMKTGSTTADWVTPASRAEADNTLPITAAAVYTEIGNINALLATI